MTQQVEAHRRKSGTKRFIRDLVLIVVAAVIISVGIKTFLLRSFYIPSPSMTNTLQVDDRIVVDELVPRLLPIKHGDVVVFSDPGGWLQSAPLVQPNLLERGLSIVGLSATDGNNHLVKRVIGLPGDTVVCCTASGRLTVNGIAIDEKKYLNLPNGQNRASTTAFTVTVPKNSLWVMGDNRDNSEDSRAHVGLPTKGFVPESAVVGRAIVITWPSARWSWLDDYPTVFGSVPHR